MVDKITTVAIKKNTIAKNQQKTNYTSTSLCLSSYRHLCLLDTKKNQWLPVRYVNIAVYLPN